MQTNYHTYTTNRNFYVWNIDTYNGVISEEYLKNYKFGQYLRPGNSIFTIGSGPGILVKVFSDNGFRLLGNDLNEQTIDQAGTLDLAVGLIDAFLAVYKCKTEYSVLHLSGFAEHIPLTVSTDIHDEISQVKNAIVYIATPNLGLLIGCKFWLHLPFYITLRSSYVLNKLLTYNCFFVLDSWTEYSALSGQGWRLNVLHQLPGSQDNIFMQGADICVIAKVAGKQP